MGSGITRVAGGFVNALKTVEHPSCEGQMPTAKLEIKKKSPPGRASSLALLQPVGLPWPTTIPLVLPKEDRIVNTTHLEIAHPIERVSAHIVLVY
jgi:hypothetical protein